MHPVTGLLQQTGALEKVGRGLLSNTLLLEETLPQVAASQILTHG